MARAGTEGRQAVEEGSGSAVSLAEVSSATLAASLLGISGAMGLSVFRETPLCNDGPDHLPTSCQPEREGETQSPLASVRGSIGGQQQKDGSSFNSPPSTRQWKSRVCV